MNDNTTILQKDGVLLTPAQSNLLANYKDFDPSKLPYQNVIHQTVINNQRETEKQFEQISKTVEKRDKAVTDRLDKQIELLEAQLHHAEITNTELQAKLNKANFELKQLNDKESSQRLELKELRADLKEESLKREIAETKLNAKDWKTAFIALGSAIFVLAVEHWKDIYDFILSLIEL